MIVKGLGQAWQDDFHQLLTHVAPLWGYYRSSYERPPGSSCEILAKGLLTRNSTPVGGPGQKSAGLTGRKIPTVLPTARLQSRPLGPIIRGKVSAFLTRIFHENALLADRRGRAGCCGFAGFRRRRPPG